MLFLLLFVIIVWFFVDYFIHVFGTPKENKPYDYVNFDTFYKEFDIRTKNKRCDYDDFDKAFEFSSGGYYAKWEVIFTKHTIKFDISGTKMMILVNPLDYLKYRWFFFVLKFNYKGRNHKKGLFEYKDGE